MPAILLCVKHREEDRVAKERTVMTNKDRGQGRPTCLIPAQALVY